MLLAWLGKGGREPVAVVRRGGMQRCRAAAEPLPSRVTLSRAVQDVCRGCLLQTQDADVSAE